MVGQMVGPLVGQMVGHMVGQMVGPLVGQMVGQMVGHMAGQMVGHMVDHMVDLVVSTKKCGRPKNHYIRNRGRLHNLVFCGINPSVVDQRSGKVWGRPAGWFFVR